MEKLQNAKKLLETGNYTCVACSQNKTLTSDKRGVAPLLEWLDSELSLADFSCADKVVGAGAAFLYVKLGARMLYAAVISERALAVLEAYGVSVSYSSLVPSIKNRTGDGNCPMETAVRGIDDPDAAVAAIRAKLLELKNNK